MRIYEALILAAVSLATLAGPTNLRAQDLDDLRERYLLEDPADFVRNAARAQPGSTAASPSAFGAAWGDVFLGAGYQHQVRYTDLNDGTVVFGLGLGDRKRFVALEAALTSVSTFRSGFFERNTVSFKLHRMLGDNVGVAAGVENAVVLQDGTDGGRSFYGALTGVSREAGWHPFRSITATVGVGDGRFRFEEDVIADEGSVNAFASLGVQIFRPVSVIADWAGQDLALALSLVPFRRVPLVITPAIADVTGSAGDGARFMVGAGLGYQLPF